MYHNYKNVINMNPSHFLISYSSFDIIFTPFDSSGVLYCATRSYTSMKGDEVSVKIGAVVEVLQKSDDGWWLIRYFNLTVLT